MQMYRGKNFPCGGQGLGIVSFLSPEQPQGKQRSALVHMGEIREMSLRFPSERESRDSALWPGDHQSPRPAEDMRSQGDETVSQH